MAGYESEGALRLPHTPENGVWIGPDLQTTKSFTLAPESLTATRVGLPPADIAQRYLDPGGMPFVSTRSVLAQLNTEVIRGTEQQIVTGINEGRSEVEVLIHNHSRQAIDVDAGTGVGRLIRWSPNNIVGDELEELVQDSIIILEGQHGKDWDFLRDPQTDEPTGLLLPLDERYQRELLPGHEITITPYISGTEFRDQLDEWLTPINGRRPTVLISQTRARLYLPPHVHALIDDEDQLNSLFLRGGQTGFKDDYDHSYSIPWPVRSEHLIEDELPDALAIRLGKSHVPFAA